MTWINLAGISPCADSGRIAPPFIAVVADGPGHDGSPCTASILLATGTWGGAAATPRTIKTAESA